MTEPEHPHTGTPHAGTPHAGQREPAEEERPFTDYGQFGVDMIDTRVLWQDQVWVDRLGVPHALHEMSRDYVANVIDYLHRRAPAWHLDALIDATADLADAMGDQDQEPLREPAERLRSVLALDPVQWVDATPLMHALRRSLERALGRDG